MRALQAAAELLADEAQETQHTSTGGAKAAGGKKKKKKKGKKKTTSAASKTGELVCVGCVVTTCHPNFRRSLGCYLFPPLVVSVCTVCDS